MKAGFGARDIKLSSLLKTDIYSYEGVQYAAFSLSFPTVTFLSRHKRLLTVNGTEYFELTILRFHNTFNL